MTVKVREWPHSLLLLDTHTLIWSVEYDPKLGSATKDILNQAAQQNQIRVSAITPWEIGLLVNKGRLKLSSEVMEWIRAALSKPGVQLAPLDPEIAVESTRLPWEMHSDPADRILVATARKLGATLVTADQALLAMGGSGKFRVMDATL